MKKIISVLLIILSLQAFGTSYKVNSKTGLKLSERQLAENNSAIEKETKLFIQKLFSKSEQVFKDFKNEILKEIKNEEEILSSYFIFNLVSSVFKNSRFEIKEIKYMSDSEAEVILEFKIPNIELIDDKNFEKIIEKNISEKLGYSVNDINNMDLSNEDIIKISDIITKTVSDEIRNIKQYKTEEKIELKFLKNTGIWKIENEDEIINEIVNF